MLRLATLSLLLTLLCSTQIKAQTQQLEVSPDAVKVYVKSIHCETCAKKIRSRIFTVKGVQRVTTSVKKNLAIVEPFPGKEVSPRQLWEAMEEGNFEMDRIETPQTTFAKKPEA